MVSEQGESRRPTLHPPGDSHGWGHGHPCAAQSPEPSKALAWQGPLMLSGGRAPTPSQSRGACEKPRAHPAEMAGSVLLRKQWQDHGMSRSGSWGPPPTTKLASPQEEPVPSQRRKGSRETSLPMSWLPWWAMRPAQGPLLAPGGPTLTHQSYLSMS